MNDILFSHDSDEWYTPIDFFNYCDSLFHFTLDPCCSFDNKKCSKFYTKEDNGLLKNWSNEVVFCNPPYSNIYEWSKKCYLESLKGALVVLLIPSRTDTKYFHDFILGKADIIFIKGRLKFGGKSSAPFPSMLCIFPSGGRDDHNSLIINDWFYS